MNYKAPDNSLHVIEPEFAYLLPAGCVEITEAEAEAIRAASIPTPTHEHLVLQAETWARSVRLDLFKILDGLQISALVTNDLTTAQAIEVAKQALRDITTTVDLSSFTTYEEMQQAFIYTYWQIRANVPQNIKSAFDSLVP